MGLFRFVAALLVAIGIVYGVAVLPELAREHTAPLELGRKASTTAPATPSIPESSTSLPTSTGAKAEPIQSPPPLTAVVKKPLPVATQSSPKSATGASPPTLVVGTQDTPLPVPTSSAPEVQSTSGPSTEGILLESEIFRLTNVERTSHGLTPLSWNTTLAQIARAKAEDMLNLQYFAHESPDGIDIAGLAKKFGYEYRFVGENLAEGDFRTNADLVDGWMNSPGHRANILNTDYTEMGAAAIFGVYEGRKAWMAVQEFGKPMPACPNPDAQKKALIDIYDGQIKQLEVTLNNLQSAMQEGSGDQSKNVSDYNTIVALHNKLVGELKAYVTEYNASVKIYNACIAS